MLKLPTLTQQHCALGVLLLVTVLPTWAEHEQPNSALAEGVEIRRTTDGIPHLRANTWRGLGVGVGYVQAQDALCTLAEAFVTYEGHRSWFFGAEARPQRNSTLGRPKNLDLDFFFRSFADDSTLAQLQAEQPPELTELLEGFAAGYNRYLTEARRSQLEAPQTRACLHQDWVREIGVKDLYRRIYSAQIAAGYARFIPEIVNAQPNIPKVAEPQGVAALREQLAKSIGEQGGLGSNALALGSQVTGEQNAVLFGNPHWYWGGPDRFYQMHLTIPNQLNVAGVSFLGIPLIMLGFNEHIAWTHTVSAARRFGLFDLSLDPNDPSAYQIDGQREAMLKREVSVAVRDTEGHASQRTRILYSTRFGSMLDLGQKATAFGWSSHHALAIRDINSENFRVLRHFFYWNQAKSLDDFIAIQQREMALPWINTLAIGRDDGRVWYADVGAAPNVSDELRQSCITPLGKAFARVDTLTPVLDGSRSECQWQTDERAVQSGAMPVQSMPKLVRDDYVANMNDSYWLTNVYQSLEGFASILGGERQALSLRSQLGHQIALELAQTAPRAPEQLGHDVMQTVLNPRAYSAERFKDELLTQACASTTVSIKETAQKVDVSHACDLLRRWPNKADADDQGVRLWERFWAVLNQMAPAFYQTPFSPETPLKTPSHPQLGAQAAQALAAAVTSLATEGADLEAPLGKERFVETGGRQIPVYGGCQSAGYFTIACNREGGERLGANAMANSYLQVVYFGPKGVEAHTLLAHGQDEAAVEQGQGIAPIERYSRKDWLHFPFYEDQIARDPELSRIVLQPE